MKQTIIGLFTNPGNEPQVLDTLQHSGFSSSEVGFVTSDGSGTGSVAVALAHSGPDGLPAALRDSGVPEEQGRHWAERLGKGGGLVVVRASGEEPATRAESILATAGADEVRRYAAVVQSTGGYDPADAHAAPGNYGEEGGSSQWGQTVLRVKDDEETEVAERAFSRDRGSERLD